jgi:MFS family permease
MQHRPFVLFWLARGSNSFAYQIMSVALGWQIYDLTRRPLDLGLVGLVQFVACLIMTIPAGHVADKYPQRLIMRLCMAAFSVVSLALTAATMTGRLSLPLIYALAMALGAVRAFEGPSGSVLMVELVPRADLGRAIAADSSIRQAAAIAGPAVGGLLYGGSASLAYGACAAAYLMAFLFLAALPQLKRESLREPPSAAALFAGFAYVKSDAVMRGAMVLDLLALLLGSVTALLPVYARDVLQAGPLALGLLRGAQAVGAVAVALLLARVPLRRHGGRLMIVSVAIYAVSTCVFALSRNIAVSLVALVILGASDQLSVNIRNLLVQLRTPDAMRGRISAISNIFILTSVHLGEFRAGALAALLGPVECVLVGGVVTLALAASWPRIFPALWRVDRLLSPDPETLRPVVTDMPAPVIAEA